jgi:hypothetical protein
MEELTSLCDALAYPVTAAFFFVYIVAFGLVFDGQFHCVQFSFVSW